MLLELPEVGCLSGEGDPMYLAGGEELFAVVIAEEEVYALVGVYAEELADGLDVRISVPESLASGRR
jgi:hypothetical protein